MVAACIAFLAASRSVRGQRETARKQQWWDRARWALDLTLSEESLRREVGIGVLDALGSSEFADEHEVDLVEAAIRPTGICIKAKAANHSPDDSARSPGLAPSSAPRTGVSTARKAR